MVEQVKVFALFWMVLRLRELLIQEQTNDSKFGGLYCYLEDAAGISSLNAGMFEKMIPVV